MKLHASMTKAILTLLFLVNIQGYVIEPNGKWRKFNNYLTCYLFYACLCNHIPNWSIPLNIKYFLL